MNGNLFVEFVVPFIINALSLQRKIKAFLMNENPFVDFGFPFLKNVFLFQRNMKVLLMRGNLLVEFGLLFVGQAKLCLAISNLYTEDVCRCAPTNRGSKVNRPNQSINGCGDKFLPTRHQNAAIQLIGNPNAVMLRRVNCATSANPYFQFLGILPTP